MKKLTLALTSSVLAAACAVSFAACSFGGEKEPPLTPDKILLLDEAIQSDIFAENLTVTTTDTRTDKFGYYPQKERRIGTDGNFGKSYSDESDNPQFPYKYYASAEKTGDAVKVKTLRHDLREDMQGTEYEYFISEDDYNLNNYGGYAEGRRTAAQWIGRFAGFWGGDWFQSSCFSASNGGVSGSLPSGIPYTYTQSSNAFEFKNVYFATSLNGTATGYYACTVTVKLDGQNRLSKTTCAFNGNGKLESTYVYGSTAVNLPETFN